MVSAFSDLAQYQSHVIETARLAPSEVLAITQQGLAEGRFRLGWQA
jgi:hypothetical protein